MKIGLDIMGGDFAPEATVLGAIAAYKDLAASQKLVLIGDKQIAVNILRENNFSPDHFEFVHTTEMIEMDDHPAKAFCFKNLEAPAFLLALNCLRTAKLMHFRRQATVAPCWLAPVY